MLYDRARSRYVRFPVAPLASDDAHLGGIMWLLVLVSLLVIWATPSRNAEVQPVGGKPTATLDAVETEPVKLIERDVAPFTLTERSGETVTNETLQGRPWVANFIFTSCVASCPANTAAMMKLVNESPEADVQFVTITVDPERDTPERLSDYAEIYGADPDRWWFLTGDKQEIHDLIRNSFLQAVEEREGENRLLGYEFAHSDRVMHMGADGKIIGQYLATDPKEMVKLRRVLAGEMETPEENRFLTAVPADEVPDGAETVEVEEVVEQQPAAEELPPPLPELEEVKEVPAWVERLPAVNAGLNSLATLLLIAGFVFVRRQKLHTHRNCMISAFVVSVVFLGCYLTYHFSLQYYTGASSKSFPNLGFVRQVYLTILISHILLAVAVPVLALGTLYQAARQNWARHKTWARITFPIWLYVSVTGVVIYVMLYHLAPAYAAVS